MGLKKTDEERAQQQAQRQEQDYWASPVGQAHAQYQAGAEFFQFEIEISKVGGWGTASGFGSSSNTVKSTGGKPDLLGQIEAVGWYLQHVGYVFVETGATTSNRLTSTGQGIVTRGQVMGIYLFRARR